jgi:hypothetical protein
MKNKDFILQQRREFAQKFKAALDSKDEEALAKAFDEYSTSIQQSLIDTANEIKASSDSAILTRRGIRQLTSSENEYYNKLITAMKSTDPKQALKNPELTIPQTVIDTVITDIEQNHPLLNALNIQNTYGSVKWIYSDDTQKMSAWGKITSAITEELSESIHTLEFGTNKLSAFIPVPKDILDLGASYIDAYIRTILADAAAYGLEYGFIKGTGKDMPIGMCKDIKGAVTEGVYPDKDKTKLTSFAVDKYCEAVAKLSKNDSGKSRIVPAVALIVSPVDYIGKVIPATTVLATDGSYKNNIFPFPTVVYQSEMVDEGTAILGILERYVACLSTGKEGKVEYDDSYHFLEDERMYTIKIFATGRAKDSHDFLYLDISKLEALKLNVTLENATT